MAAIDNKIAEMTRAFQKKAAPYAAVLCGHNDLINHSKPGTINIYLQFANTHFNSCDFSRGPARLRSRMRVRLAVQGARLPVNFAKVSKLASGFVC
jgi:hypothetical protein